MAFRQFSEQESQVVMCPKCQTSVEILNNDIPFSLELHIQSHKSLEEITKDMENILRKTYFDLRSGTNKESSDFCSVCKEKVAILNNDVRLSLQLHAQKHQTQTSSENNDSNQSLFDNYNSLSLVAMMEKLSLSSNLENSTVKVQYAPVKGAQTYPAVSEVTLKSSTNMDLNELLSLLPRELSISGRYIVENEPGILMCSVCNCYLSKSFSVIKEHLNGKNHKKSQQSLNFLSVNKRGEQICRVCNCKLSSGINNIKTHAAGASHQINQKTQNNAIKNVNILRILKKLSQQLEKNKCMYIIENKRGEPMCSLCDCTIPLTVKNIKEHLIGNSHEIKAASSAGVKLFENRPPQQHLKNVIHPKNRKDFICSLCNCKIVGFCNIESHIHGKHHQKLL